MPKAEMSSGRFDEYNGKIAKVIDNVEKVMIGKSEIIQLSIVSILCGGHTLLEDVPGVGKTMLVKALAKSLGCSFKRIQFTPDLLPSDVTGMSVYNQKTMQFEYRPGPIMGNVVLADEINRTSPKTQAALLEAMEEGSVTIDGETHLLPTPFFVMATQNPIEYEGTFPLPEAQLDRFLIKLRLGYPQLEEEVEMLSRLQVHHPIESVKAVISSEELKDLQQSVRNIYVEDSIRRYIVRLTEATRTHPKVYLGASPPRVYRFVSRGAGFGTRARPSVCRSRRCKRFSGSNTGTPRHSQIGCPTRRIDSGRGLARCVESNARPRFSEVVT